MDGAPEERVITVLQRLLAEGSVNGFPGPDINLLEFGLNSLDIINFVIALEAEFDLTIPESAITPKNLLSLSAITSLITSLLNNR
jgi:acyl carrier protein